ncbi:TonB-dependent receptor [Comamonas sp. Y33R10-2]|uniref:TonB-dependent receptor domain-containing protein n=1 Tax=Comamonas sp. Y33R10-2 TaxID=2853257 RepID=UPI001C5C8FE7|nr:TonB-dependent receptor [Comamonas sp. Y33R10-2]QXZ09188.1 TonB-dependent receptor [Comamonas sp. Y33R10-2]
MYHRSTLVAAPAVACSLFTCATAAMRRPRNSLAAAMLGAGLLSQGAALAADTEMETVVVTASGHEQSIVDAPASISVITREELEKQSYTDIADAVRNIPGVNVTNGGNNQDISIRGMSASYTLYLVDGRPVSTGRSVNTNGADGGKQIGLPSIAMIERIEVIRGPMSSLYGSDAMGGVINIITRKTADKWHGQLGTEFTKSFNDISNDGRQVDGFVAGPIIPGLLGLKAGGGYTSFDESTYIGGSDGAASRPESKRQNGNVELTLTPDKNNTVRLGYTTARQDTTQTPGLSIAPTATGKPTEYRYDKEVMTLSHEGRYGNLMTSTYFQRDVSEKVQELTKKETVNVLNSQGTYAWGKHLITFGGQYKTEKVINETNGLLTALPGVGVSSADRWIGALFSEVDWSVTQKLSVTTGLRYDRDEFFGGHLSPRVYGIYRHTPQWTLKGGVSTGYKQPSLAQSTAGIGSTTGGGGWQSFAPNNRALSIGNPDLKPETSTSFEVGGMFQSVDKKLNASLMVFHTNFDDKIAEDRYCTSPNARNNNDYANWGCSYGANRYYFLSTNKNVDKARMQGLEVTGDYRFSPALKFSSSYTYTHSKQLSGDFAGQPLNKQPKHMLNAVLDWKVNAKLNVWTQANYRGKTSDYLSRTTMADGTPAYALLNIGVVYRLTGKARVRAALHNVTNRQVTNSDYGVVLDGRRMSLGLTVDF